VRLILKSPFQRHILWQVAHAVVTSLITEGPLYHDQAFFGPKVYETIIPRNIRVAEAPSHGKPILLYDFDCAGSQAYIKLATEIIERERRNQAA